MLASSSSCSALRCSTASRSWRCLRSATAIGPCEVGVDQLLAPALDSLQPSALGAEQLRFGGSLLGHLPVDRVAGEDDQLGGEPHLPPVLEDLLLDQLSRQVGQITVGALLVAAETEEVGVETAALAPGGAEAEA